VRIPYYSSPTHQEVCGRLRVDVLKGETLLVLVDDCGRDLLGNNLVENGGRTVVSGAAAGRSAG
jgi:hypothetical protein